MKYAYLSRRNIKIPSTKRLDFTNGSVYHPIIGDFSRRNGIKVVKRKSGYFVEYKYEGHLFKELIGKNKRIAGMVLRKIKSEITESRKNVSV